MVLEMELGVGDWEEDVLAAGADIVNVMFFLLLRMCVDSLVAVDGWMRQVGESRLRDERRMRLGAGRSRQLLLSNGARLSDFLDVTMPTGADLLCLGRWP